MRGYSTLARSRAQRLRKSSTDAELKLWRELRNRQLQQFKFRRQHPIAGYIVDFVCLEKQLVIEVDGAQHAEHRAYDAARTAALGKAGYRVVRFWDNEVLLNTDGVMEAIYVALGCPSP